MRLYLVIDETCFYQQNFVARFLEKTQDEVVGAALVTRIPKKNNIHQYLFERWYHLRFFEILKLLTLFFVAKLFDVFLPKKREGRFYSVKSVFKFFRVPFIEVKDDMNQEAYIHHIKSKNPDVLISSNSLYFHKNILKLPRICCINRHSALLPSYGGLFPVLQAYLHAETYTGVSVHMMNRHMDAGAVLSQKKIEISKKDTVASLYKKCFEISAKVVLEALNKIKENDFSPVYNHCTASYYSFPTKEHWKTFREKGGRFI